MMLSIFSSNLMTYNHQIFRSQRVKGFKQEHSNTFNMICNNTTISLRSKKIAAFWNNLLLSWLIFCPKKLSKAMVFRMMWKKSPRWSSLSWHQFLLLIRVSKWIYSSQLGFIENLLVKTWAQACLHRLHYLNSSTRSGKRSLAWLSRKAPIQNSEVWKLPWMKSCCEVSECENEYAELKCENMWKAEYSEIRWWYFCLKKKTFVARSCARNIIPGRAGVQKSWNLCPGWWASVSKPRMQSLNHARCHELWTDRTEARWGWTRYPFAWFGTKWPTLTNWMRLFEVW